MSTVEQVKPASVSATGGPGAWWDNARTFFAEVRNETRRVTWPSRREVYATTLWKRTITRFRIASDFSRSGSSPLTQKATRFREWPCRL